MSWGPFLTGLASGAKGGVTDSSTSDVASSFTSRVGSTYVSSILASVSLGERLSGGLWLSFLEEPERLFDMMAGGIRNVCLRNLIQLCLESMLQPATISTTH